MIDPGLRRHAIGVIAGFGLQFIAGMVLNLFVTIPKTHPGTSGGEYFSRSWASLLWVLSGQGGWALTAHVVIAFSLLIGTVSLFVRTLNRRARGWRIASGIAAFFTLGALFNGLSFLDFNEDFSSMIMACCWLIAVSLLVFLIERKAKVTQSQPSARPPVSPAA